MKIKKNQGFSLIEVMVTILISAFGIQTYAFLQINALKNTNAALHRSHATIMANDIADRIRANVPGAWAGGYNQDLVTENLNNCSSECSDYEYATYEVYQWLELIKSHLSSGKGQISCVDSDETDLLPCSNNSVHTVMISWKSVNKAETNASMIISIRQ